MNVYDAERMEKGLLPLGYEGAGSAEEADLIIVNTCAIREKAEQKVFSFLGRLAALKRKRPEMIIAVGGCVAQQEGRAILERVPHVDAVFGTHAVGRLPEIIGRVHRRRERVVDVDPAAGTPTRPEPAHSGERPLFRGVSRFVTIMRGCDNYCTYCVVPYVRGRETSRPPEAILAEIRGLVAAGAREVTLLGQNVNSYGRKEGLPDFPELLTRIAGIDGLYRIRFTTSHPKDLSQALIDAFRDLEKLCNHIHLPVQSGSDRILKRMNRKYTAKDYLKRVDRLRTARPDIAVTSDFIVGFPGETGDDFRRSLDLIKAVEYDSLFAFQYSDRPNASAARFSGKVPEPEKARRLRELLGVQEELTLKKHRGMVGGIETLLVDGPSKKQGKATGAGGNSVRIIEATGRTTTNKIVNFTPEEGGGTERGASPGDLVKVRITQAFPHSLRGEVVPPGTPRFGRKGGKPDAA